MERKNKSGKITVSRNLSSRNQRRFSTSEKKLPRVEKKWFEAPKSRKKSNEARPSLLEKQDKLNSLKRQVNSLWTVLKIPDQHKLSFLETLTKLPLLDSCKMLEEEINKLKNRNAPILMLMNSIQAREDVLFLIRQKIQGRILLKVEASELLKSLRINSLEVVEALQAWKKQVRTSDFIYEDENYKEKMKYDYLFVLTSPLLNQSISCNTFFNMEKHPSQSSLKVPSHLKSRIQSAENFLKSPVKETRKSRRVLRKTSNVLSIKRRRGSAIIDAYKSAIDSPEKYDNFDAYDIAQTYLETAISEILALVVKSSYEDMVSELSISLCDEIIDEYIANSTCKVAYETHEELSHIEYIEILDYLIESEINFHAPGLVSRIASDTLISEILSHLISELPLRKIAKKAIREETKSNLELLEDIYDYVFDSMMKEEWIEVFVEEQVGEEELDKIWHLSPPTVQHQIMRSAPHKFRDRLTDIVYFDILNSIVGDLWTSSIAENYESDDLKTLMPIPDYEAQRKAMKNSLGLGLSLWKSLD